LPVAHFAKNTALCVKLSTYTHTYYILHTHVQTCTHKNVHMPAYMHTHMYMLTLTHTGTGEELTLADLMHGLGGDVRRKLPGTTRKLLEKMSGGEKKVGGKW